MALVFAIYFIYISYGYFQERILSSNHSYSSNISDERFSYVWFLTLLQCLFQYGAALLFMTFSFVNNKRQETTNPISLYSSSYAILACAYLGAMISSNSALAYINYPVIKL